MKLRTMGKVLRECWIGFILFMENTTPMRITLHLMTLSLHLQVKPALKNHQLQQMVNFGDRIQILMKLSGAGEFTNQEFCQQDSEHTMCKYPVRLSIFLSALHTYLQGPSDSCNNKTIFKELSSTAKQAILDQHNELRRKVAKGNEIEGINGPQPGASNMKKLVSSEIISYFYKYSIRAKYTDDTYSLPLCLIHRWHL